jgi:hypothetical protein
MKIRNGFVSNSSSSSFMCDVSGGMESGIDLCLSDVGMVSCKNNHMFYERYLLPEIAKEEKVVSEDEEDSEYDFYDEDEIQSERCPICQMQYVTANDAFRYLKKSLGFATEKELAKFLKDKFGSYKEFKEYLK